MTATEILGYDSVFYVLEKKEKGGVMVDGTEVDFLVFVYESCRI
jgi:hypothetical protein